MKIFYDVPTQVLFNEGDGWSAGIAFEDKVICACCGGVFPIEDLIDNLDEDIICPIYEYKDWISVTDEIAGGYVELPEGLELTEDYEIREVK